MIFPSGRQFTQHENTDCGKHGANSLQMSPLVSQASEYNDCAQRCLSNSNCDGFTVYVGTCYFKDKSCRKNMFPASRVTTFLLEGIYVHFC